MWQLIVRFAGAICACSLLACGDAATSQRGPFSPEEQLLADAVESRQYNMKDMGVAFKGLTDELRSEYPDKNMMFYNAKSIQAAARSHAHWFPEGSGPELGIETRAKTDIWQHRDDFDAGVEEFIAESNKLVTAMQSTNAGEQTAQVKSTADTCKACHDRFRRPED